MNNVLVGTASWADKSLVGCKRFYPRGCNSAEGRLRHYASCFPIVEVDSSYYAMPSEVISRLWVDRTPAEFVMNVKAFRLFTAHQTSIKVLPQDLQPFLSGSSVRPVHYAQFPPELRDELWRRFRSAVATLQEAGKLGVVHFQFPPWIVCGGAGRRHIEHCVDRMTGYRVSIEFRHASWLGAQAASTLSWLRELQVVHTVVDGPQGFTNSVPALWTTTDARTALVRLHGRNTETWNLRRLTSSTERFNYDYGDDELMDIVNHVTTLATEVEWVHVIFNNNMEDQGVRNARRLIELIDERR